MVLADVHFLIAAAICSGVWPTQISGAPDRLSPSWPTGRRFGFREPLHLFPSAAGVQHCEIAGMRDTLDRRAAHFPAFLRKWVAGKNWDIKVREIGAESKVHPTVAERFALASVQQAVAGAGPYRPAALEHHVLFKQYYPAPKQESEGGGA